MRIAKYTLYSGTMAGLTCMAALMIAARCEGRSAMQPIAASSHWIYGDRPASNPRPAPRPTMIGLMTNLGATLFWSLPFSVWLANRPPRRPARLLCEASALTGFAAFFDYVIVPRRLSPGWELALCRNSVAITFAAMAAGMAAGAWAAQRSR